MTKLLFMFWLPKKGNTNKNNLFENSMVGNRNNNNIKGLLHLK